MATISATQPHKSLSSVSELNLIEATVWKKIRSGGEKHKTVTVESLVEGTQLSKQTILDAIETLHMEGYIYLAHPDTGDALATIPEGLTGLVVSGIQVSARATVQPVLPMQTSQTREETGREEFFVDDQLIRATVLPEPAGTDGHSGRYLLNACEITSGMDNKPLIEDRPFDSKAEAWQYWDEFALELKPDPIVIVLSAAELEALDNGGFDSGDEWKSDDGTVYTIISRTYPEEDDSRDEVAEDAPASDPGELYFAVSRVSRQQARYVTEAVLTSDGETDKPLEWHRRAMSLVREME